jgi:L-lactate dehydrogenase complex protein LldE
VRISLFIACYNDTLFPETGNAVVRVLEKLGHQVEFLPDQTCCGQMHWNTGYRREAIPIIRHFLHVYRDTEVICIPSSSCVAMIREHYPKAAEETGDRGFVSDVESLLPRVYEFSELLVKKFGIDDVGAAFPHRVTYHASCHSLRSLQLGDIPMRLLRRVRNIELVDLPNIDRCCGFGGTFAIKNADVSSAMLEEKIGDLTETRAQICTAVDNSCLMQLYGGLHRRKSSIRTMHLAEILACDGDARVAE